MTKENLAKKIKASFQQIFFKVYLSLFNETKQIYSKYINSQ